MDFFAGQEIRLCGSFPESTEVMHHTPIYYGIQYNYVGKLFLSIDHRPAVTAEGPHVFITHPGAYFEYGCVDGVPRHHNFICSTGPRIEQYVASGLMDLDPEDPLVSVAEPERFMQTMNDIISLHRHHAVLPPRAILLYEDLLLQIHESRARSRRLPPFQQDFIRKLIDAIRSAPTARYDFARQARRCGVTTTHFRRLFKIEAGMPPLQFLTSCRLQYAAGLLISTRLSIAAVAESAGLGNQFYFSRLFKRRFQLSPQAYRREYLGEP